MRATAPLFLCLASCVIAENIAAEDFIEELNSGFKEGDVVQVSMVTRHGQRTPKNPYPSDPWRDSKHWPEGWLQLTEEGAKQHKSLGNWLRDRYPQFIPPQYKTSDILVRSTGISRTLASAFALTSALYPGQAVPIHSAPSEFDKLFSPHKTCPAFDQELERFTNTPEFRLEEYHRRPFYEWLSEQIGRKVNGLESAESLYSLMMIEQQRNYTLPKWTQLVYPQPLKNMTGRYLSRSSATPLLARLRYGTLLKDIIFNAENGGMSSKFKKILIYSGHDFTVIGLLNCLGLFDGAPSGFAASLIFEVRRGNFENGNTIEIFYRNDSFADPKQMFIEKCGTPCYVKKLKEVLQPIIPEDIDKECFKTQKRVLCAIKTAEDVSLLWATALGSAGLGALLVVFCTKLYICGRPPLWQMYQPHIMNSEQRKPNYSTLNGDNYERI